METTRVVADAVTKRKLTDISDVNSFRSKLRRKRIKYLIDFIGNVIRQEQKTFIRICDIGGNYAYWNIFPFEQFKTVQFEITLLNIEENKFFNKIDIENVQFKIYVADACDMYEIMDAYFDIAHSNSVIEHVGNWTQIKNFASELKRVSNYYYVQTPNYWFPVEPHYVLPLVHFLPRPWHTACLMKLKKISFDRATALFEQNRMLSKREFSHVFSNSHFITERFYLLPKSFIVTSRFV